MDILITEVTEMSPGTFCVAGWSNHGQRMVRPLPGGRNWSAALLAQAQVEPGATIRVIPGAAANGPFPHRTEDTPIDPARIVRVGQMFGDWLGANGPPFARSLNEGFGGALQYNRMFQNIRQSVFVAPNTESASLVAIRANRDTLTLTVAFDRLKAIIMDLNGRYALTVSSRALKEAFKQGGLAAARAALPQRQEYCLRIGLARPFQEPPKCFAMLNGVL